MPTSYSANLRQRVIEAVASGVSRREGPTQEDHVAAVVAIRHEHSHITITHITSTPSHDADGR
jgi:hypothetical protein